MHRRPSAPGPEPQGAADRARAVAMLTAVGIFLAAVTLAQGTGLLIQVIEREFVTTGTVIGDPAHAPVWIEPSDHVVAISEALAAGSVAVFGLIALASAACVGAASVLHPRTGRALGLVLGVVIGGAALNISSIAAHGAVRDWLAVRMPGARPFAYSTGDITICGGFALGLLTAGLIAFRLWRLRR